MLLTSRLSAHAVAMLLLQLVSRTQATLLDTVLDNQECGLVMFDVYGDYDWPGIGYGDYYGQMCQNPNCVVSIYAALYTYCPEDQIQPGIDIINDWCTNYGDVSLAPASDYAANLTKEAIAALPILNEGDLEEDSNVTAPFLMSQAWFDVAMRSEHAYDLEQRLHAYYTLAGYGFWCVIIVFGIVQNVIRKTVEKRRGYIYADAESSGRPASTPGFFGKSTAAVRKYFVTPSALPPYHTRRFLGCTIPTRAESFVVLTYWIISIVLGAVNIHSFNGNIFWEWSAPQIWRYIADRTGTMSYGNIPLLWMFSGRNNVFIWLTGWSFGTFNIFHRHVARIATLQGIMHSIGYTGYYFSAGYGDYYKSFFDELWWSLAFGAVVVMSFTVLFSFSYFRNKLYENFLLLHIILSILILVFLYYHTAIFDLTNYNYPFLLTACVIWGFERFLRLVRQAYCNIHVSRNRGRGVQTTKATVTYHETANILTIDVVPANAKLFAGPGQHYFLYQPLRLLGWENHPFTLAHWAQAAPGGDLHLQFWVRPYDGWTKKLVKDCRKSGGPTATISTALLLEGPYGASEPLHTFDQVLLVAGGSGIAGVLPYLLDYVRRAEQGAAAGSGGRIPTRTRNVTLVWTDRREEYIRFIADGPLAGLLGRPDIDVAFHLTSATSATPASAVSNNVSTASSSTDAVQTPTGDEKTAEVFDGEKASGGILKGSAEDISAVKKSHAGQYRIQAGRPDVLSTVRKLSQSVQGTSARLAVMVCGPNDLSDNVRHVVAENMEANRESIEYFEESFGW